MYGTVRYYPLSVARNTRRECGASREHGASEAVLAASITGRYDALLRPVACCITVDRQREMGGGDCARCFYAVIARLESHIFETLHRLISADAPGRGHAGHPRPHTGKWGQLTPPPWKNG